MFDSFDFLKNLLKPISLYILTNNIQIKVNEKKKKKIKIEIIS